MNITEEQLAKIKAILSESKTQPAAPGEPIRPQFNCDIERGLLERINNAIYWFPGLTKRDMANEALTKWMAEFEQKYNDGKRYPKAPKKGRYKPSHSPKTFIS